MEEDKDTTSPTITITAPTKTDNTAITDTTIQVTDPSGITAANVTVDGTTTATTSNFSCTQTSATQVDCTIQIDDDGDLTISATDDLSNGPATETESNYVIDTTPPVVAITSSPTATSSNETSYPVSGTCTIGDGDVTVAIAGATPANQTATCSPTGTW